jgi:hypothetical protein
MISTFRLPLLACLAVPVAAHGAAYECTVDMAFSVGLQREANGRTCVNGFGSVVRRAS